MRRTSQHSDPIRDAAFSALELILDQLLDLMFDVGISVQELNYLVRSRAVHVASRRLARDGGRHSKSRVAIVTGLPRSEVAKFLKVANARQRAGSQQPARRTLMGWFNDSRFLTADGEPAILPIFGKRRSFESLVSRYGAGIPVRAMLDELTQIGAVQHLADQRVSAKTQIPIPADLTPSVIETVGEHCKDLLGTLIKNIRRIDRPMFEATSVVCDASPKMLPIIRKEIAEQGTNLINATSSILKRSQGNLKKGSANRNARRVGVTVFYFEESTQATTDDERIGNVTQRTNLRRRK